MNIENEKIETLVHDPRNARKHFRKNIDAIKSSLQSFGQQKPIVVGKNNVVLAGNGTLTAAKELGWTEIAIVRTALDENQATAYAIYDNRTAEMAIWDHPQLNKQLSELHTYDFNLEDLGFDIPDYNLSNTEDEENHQEEKCQTCGKKMKGKKE